MSDVLELYQAVILDHHRAPRNAGRLADPTHSAELNNPLCGDHVVVTLRVGQPGVIEARCDVRGCALCRASGSLLTELVLGQPLAQVTARVERFLALFQPGQTAGAHDAAPSTASSVAERGPDSELSAAGAPVVRLEGTDAAELGSVEPLLQVQRFPSRVRCATLAWEALRTALGTALQDSARVPC
jgi:nitrogen fixation protein NifU and related proteins